MQGCIRSISRKEKFILRIIPCYFVRVMSIRICPVVLLKLDGEIKAIVKWFPLSLGNRIRESVQPVSCIIQDIHGIGRRRKKAEGTF